MNTKLKDAKGFTIIEVLIVLAIAALIMLIVFLAIPQLRKNQRNTTMRNEASRFLSAATEYEANANGTKLDDLTKATAVYNGLGTLKELTSLAGYGAGSTAEGEARVVNGTCNGTVLAATGGRTYAVQFGLVGGTTACIQS